MSFVFVTCEIKALQKLDRPNADRTRAGCFMPIMALLASRPKQNARKLTQHA
jgi:hypothetical protein